MRRYGIHGDCVKRICFFVVVAFALCFFVPHPACSQDEGRINIHEGGNTYKVVYFRNHALSTYNPNIRRAVIAIHGAERGAQFQYNTMRDAACLPGTPPCSRLDSTIIIAPHFMEEDDLAGYDLEDDGLFWSSGWKFGDLSKDTTAHPRADRISSYDVMDRIIYFLATGGSFPNLEDIVIAGHSAGGQYVNRYAAISPAETSIAGTGVDVKYIIANPSSYVYFTDERVYPGTMDTFFEPNSLWSSLCPDPDCCPDDPDPCPLTYDDYIYGLSGGLNTYVGDVVDDIGIPGIMTRYADKKVTILLGRLDKNPCDSSLDKSCGANLEGRYRLERGLIYHNYIGHALGDAVYMNHSLETIKNGHHSSIDMWQSNLGRRHIFDITPTAELPELISPNGSIGDIDQTYKWYAVPGATRYRLVVTDTTGGGGSFEREYTPEELNCPHGGVCSKEGVRSNTEATWTIWVKFIAEWFETDTPLSFTVSAPGPSTPRLPTGTIADHTPSFKWDAVEGASRYQLAVYGPTGINYIRWYSAEDANCDCTPTDPKCVVTPDTVLNDGNNWWMVRPSNPIGVGPWTAPTAYTVETPDHPGSGMYYVKVRSSGKCLDYDYTDAGNVFLRDCRGWNNQKWNIGGVLAASYLTTEYTSSSNCLEADTAGGADTWNGGNVQVGSCNTWATGDHEEWEIEKARDGYYTLSVGSSGKCLDADNYASKDMTECGNVQIWDCKDPATRNTDNQEWRIESVTDDEFRNPRQPMDYPVPDIKVNGSDRRTEVRRSSIVTVTFALNNHFTVGPDADWWIIQTGPYGLQFLTPTGWTTTPRPLLQGALFTFPSPVVELPLSTAGLATGTYWLYFAVDTNRDSNFSLNFLYLDGVRVDLVP